MTKTKSKNSRNLNKKLKKEPFRPDLSVLNMSLREAYNEVSIKQKEISVAMGNLLPKDINIKHN